MNIVAKRSILFFIFLASFIARPAFSDEFVKNTIESEVGSSSQVAMIKLKKYLGSRFQVEIFNEIEESLHVYDVEVIEHVTGKEIGKTVCLPRQFIIGTKLLLVRDEVLKLSKGGDLLSAIDKHCSKGDAYFESQFNNEVFPIEEIFVDDEVIRYLSGSSELHRMSDNCDDCLVERRTLSQNKSEIYSEEAVLVPLDKVIELHSESVMPRK